MTTARDITMKNKPLVSTIAALLLAGCTSLEIDNEIPVAVARVFVGSMEYPTLEVPYPGTPIEVTLDGRSSTDEDGNITKWEWVRTDVSPVDRFGMYEIPPMTRFLPSMAPAPYGGDPAPGPTTKVTLEGGVHQFSLWVTDDDKEISEPATISIVVSQYMPDPACMMAYENTTRPNCEECLCSPNSTMGCLEEFQACANNADPTFNELCLAIVECSVRVGCSAAGCYTADTCMAEIDAASAHAGQTVATCAPASGGDPATNPCSASSALGTCTATFCAGCTM